MTTGGAADIFISYKREDEARVARLVSALEGADLSVWWDRGLPGGEEWRANIEAALDAAKVVIVCWTRASVGPDGGFVRDEASRAKGRLIPVLLERGVRAPLGFGEVQSVDLSHWGGNANDPFFQDLLALIIAKRDGKPAPKPRGPASRAMRRFVFGGGLATAALAVAGFLWSTPVAREAVCTAPVAQPALSRSCCAVGFTPKQIRRAQIYTPAESTFLNAYLQQNDRGFPTEQAARDDALGRMPADAHAACTIVAPHQRLVSAQATPGAYACRNVGGAHYCGLNYRATCQLEEKALVEGCF